MDERELLARWLAFARDTLADEWWAQPDDDGNPPEGAEYQELVRLTETVLGDGR